MTDPLPPTVMSHVHELHDAFERAGLAYAFGGAIALGYATREPRMTIDVDVNVFVPQADAARVVAALPASLRGDAELTQRLLRDGQARVRSGMYPIDIFLNNLPVHDEAAKRIRFVRFDELTIPVLSALDIVAFKAMFNRSKDWADIVAVLEARAVSLADVERELHELGGDDAERLARLKAAANEARAS